MHKTLMMTTVLAALAVGLTGCLEGMSMMGGDKRPVKGGQAPAKGAEAKPGDYFNDQGGGNSRKGAVAESEAWRDRFLKETEKRQKLEDVRREIEEKNRKLVATSASLTTERDEYKKELEEASAMMIRLNEDLKAWKKDVLGYRAEMRVANEQTTRALARVLKLLGGELPAAPATAASPTGTTTPVKGK